MLIGRYRFSLRILDSGDGTPDTAKEVAIRVAQRSALQIIAKHLEVIFSLLQRFVVLNALLYKTDQFFGTNDLLYVSFLITFALPSDSNYFQMAFSLSTS